MPVHFKGSSEYKEHYLPNQSRKSASFVPMAEQAASAAGKDAAKLGVPMEPPLQRKKRCLGPSVTLSRDFYNMDSPGSDDYALLGANDKFITNVKYKTKRGVSPPKQKKVSAKKIEDSKENKSPPQRPAPVVNTDQFKKPQSATTKLSTPPAPRKPKDQSADIIKEVKEKKEKPNIPTLPFRSLKEPTVSQRKSDSFDVNKDSLTKLPLKDKDFNDMNDVVKKKTASLPAAPADYALKYKAGLAPPRPKRKVSEYQKCFDWKSGGKASPLLAAENVVYNSNPQVAPFKKDVVPKRSEYNTQFKAWSYKPVPEEKEESGTKGGKPKKRSRLQRSKSVEDVARTPAAGSAPLVTSDNKRLTREITERPQIPLSHGKMRKYKSEYAMNFKAPNKFSYVEGAWRGANPPHLQSTENLNENAEEKTPILANWFAEVIELRRKAQEYRKRAQGTHFSREHLVQLMAKQAQAWDTPSTVRSDHSTIEALSLASSRKEIDSARVTVGSEDTASDYQSVSDAEEEQEKDGGRVPTPKWNEAKKKRRHHLDLTTPSVGGAILSSPPQISKSKSMIRRNQMVDRSSLPLEVEDLEESDDDTVTMAPVHRPIAGQEFNVTKGPLVTSQTFGQPSLDTHLLRDDDVSQDAPLETNYIHSPLKNQNRKSQPKGVPPTINEGFGLTYNLLGKIPKKTDDDALSLASSCSLASETLERAKKRTKEFWGKNGIANS